MLRPDPKEPRIRQEEGYFSDVRLGPQSSKNRSTEIRPASDVRAAFSMTEATWQTAAWPGLRESRNSQILVVLSVVSLMISLFLSRPTYNYVGKAKNVSENF